MRVTFIGGTIVTEGVVTYPELGHLFFQHRKPIVARQETTDRAFERPIHLASR